MDVINNAAVSKGAQSNFDLTSGMDQRIFGFRREVTAVNCCGRSRYTGKWRGILKIYYRHSGRWIGVYGCIQLQFDHLFLGGGNAN